MKGWLKSRLHIEPGWEPTDRSPRMKSVQLQCANGDCVTVTREEGTALFSRTGQEDRYMPLPKRPVGDELAEELRRLDADQIYGEALGAMAGLEGLDQRPADRVHVWKDPALAARAGDGAGAMAGPGGTAA
jgi:glucose-6-phosphate dehydrogenase assembly protein OpcA